MALLLTVPFNRFEPLAWVASVVFDEMLGIPVNLSPGQLSDIRIVGEGRVLKLVSLFPDLAPERDQWIEQIPLLPLKQVSPQFLPELELEAPLPIIFGEDRIDFAEHEMECGIDIFGGIFFMLSRFEEVAISERDSRERFPASLSLAAKAGFLYRPIVDEYVELLWALMKRLWPGLVRKRREGALRISCDVDQPFDRVGKRPTALVRSIAGDLVRRRDPGLALRRTLNFFYHRTGKLEFDPYYTFEWYMSVCEKYGHKAAFYFIADHSGGAIDGSYEIYEDRVLSLIGLIAGRGHEIGMHGSYNTFENGEQIQKEKSRLTSATSMVGFDIRISGNRQHYLRWDAQITPDLLDDAEFEYDTSGSFADSPGFRYGTAYPFRMWGWTRLSPLKICQRPLVLMECSVISPNYLGLGYSREAIDLMLTLKKRALKYGGDFTLLWHNSHLLTAKDREFFQDLVSLC